MSTFYAAFLGILISIYSYAEVNGQIPQTCASPTPKSWTVSFNSAGPFPRSATSPLGILSELGNSSFSRGSYGYYFDEHGLLTRGGKNWPRIEYHPFLCDPNPNGTGPCIHRLQGLLMEEQRTNFISYSHDFSRWTSQGLSLSKAIGPDGSRIGKENFAAQTLTLESNSEVGSVSLQVELPANIENPPPPPSPTPPPPVEKLIFSFYAKDIGPQWAFPELNGTTPNIPERPAPMELSFDIEGKGTSINTGLIDVRSQYIVPGDLHSPKDPTNRLYSDIQPIGRGWFRVWIGLNTDVLPSITRYMKVTLRLRKQAGYGNSVTIWGAQLEAGRFPTSPIVTEGHFATRLVDRLILEPTTSVSCGFPWYKEGAGTFSVVGNVLDVAAADGYLINLSYKSGGRIISLVRGKTTSDYYENKNANDNLKKSYYLRSDANVFGDGDEFNHVFSYSYTDVLRLFSATDGGATLYPGAVNAASFRIPSLTKGITLPSTPTKIALGGSIRASDPRSLNGHLLRISYDTRALPAHVVSQNSSLGVLRSLNDYVPVANMSDNFNYSKEVLPHEVSDSKTNSKLVVIDEPSAPMKWVVPEHCWYNGKSTYLSNRNRNGVRIANSYLELQTRKVADPIADFPTCTPPPIPSPTVTPAPVAYAPTPWFTGIAISSATQRYGYFESLFKVVGLPTPTPTVAPQTGATFVPRLDNAFWLFPMRPVQVSNDQGNPACEIDINEGFVGNIVSLSLHKHRQYTKWTPGVAGLIMTSDGKSWRHPITNYNDPKALNQKEHNYGLLWTPQELIWTLDNQIIRRKPNYYCHTPLSIVLSSALIGGSPSKKPENIVEEMNGQHLRFNNIHTFKAP